MPSARNHQLKIAILPYKPGSSPIISPSPIVFPPRRSSSIRRVAASPSFRAGRRRFRPLPPLPREVPELEAVDNALASPPSPRRPLPSPPTTTTTPTTHNLPAIRLSPPSRDPTAPRSSHLALDSQKTVRSSSMLSPDFLSTSITPGQAAVPRNRSRRRPTELRVQTFRTNLSPAPSLRRVDSAYLSPLTPSIPQRPSPVTTKRKRIAKLRRHLGESIPPELVFRKANVGPERVETISRQLHVRIQNVKTVVRDDESAHGVDRSWVTDEAAFHPNAIRRFSRKWLQERGGRRWVEEDYEKILQALRAL